MKWGSTCEIFWKNTFSSSLIPCKNLFWESYFFHSFLAVSSHVPPQIGRTYQGLLQNCLGYGHLCSSAEYSFSIEAQAPGVLNKSQRLRPRINKFTVILSVPTMSPSFLPLPSLPCDALQFNRRHHCRRCGRLVCSSCSTKKMIVEGCRENPTRVCDQCYSYYNKEWVSCCRAATLLTSAPSPRSLYS